MVRVLFDDKGAKTREKRVLIYALAAHMNSSEVKREREKREMRAKQAKEQNQHNAPF